MSILRTSVEDRVATLTLNRPDRLNAYTVEMGIELFSALHRLDQDDAVRAIVVTGEGRAFCAGADLESGGATFARERAWQAARELEEKTRPWVLRTPVIAAINGPAVGIGATLPLQWDIRIASERAKIGFVFVRRGICPEAGSTWILPRLVGAARAAELLLTGRILSADEALGFGIVSRVVPHEQLMEVALGIARDIAENTAPVSVAVTKRLLWHQLGETDPAAGKDYEDLWFDWIGKQPDAAEGVLSFLEKRKPDWKMPKNAELPAELRRR